MKKKAYFSFEIGTFSENRFSNADFQMVKQDQLTPKAIKCALHWTLVMIPKNFSTKNPCIYWHMY